MDETWQDQLESLLAPISEEQPGGEDLAYSTLFEQIREARRADNPALTQGDWVTPVKLAEWDKVCAWCEAGLRARSKDLQLAAWYVEALVREEGFVGAGFGFRLIAWLLQRYWEPLFPVDLEERTGKLAWLDLQLGPALRQTPLTSPRQGGYAWYRWQESREVDNLGLRGDAAREEAIAEGKLSGEAFDKSARDSGVLWFGQLADDITAAHNAFGELCREVENRFGDEAPHFAGIRESIEACEEVVRRLCGQYGGGPALVPVPAPVEAERTAAAERGGSVPPAAASGGVAVRSEAIHKLREAAYWFRTHEPHSPVAALVERAAQWAEMPLEELLYALIKDEAARGKVFEMLGIDYQPETGNA
ncbi:MAG: type VI secretion system protein TssA [Azoarcus sp.]|jgi:type VI secretion system protein ImpA|nr:type VI secretion system protein TssA [Azoarcus sp.]